MKFRLTYGELLGIKTVAGGDGIPVPTLLRAALHLPVTPKDRQYAPEKIERAISTIRKWGCMLKAGAPWARDKCLNLRVSKIEQAQIEETVQKRGTGTYANLLRESLNFRPLLSTRQEAAVVSRKRKKLRTLDRKGFEEIRRVQGLEKEAKAKEIGVPHVR